MQMLAIGKRKSYHNDRHPDQLPSVLESTFIQGSEKSSQNSTQVEFLFV